MTPEELRARRRAQYLSAPAFAAYIGVHVDTLRQWESGRRSLATHAVMLEHALRWLEEPPCCPLPPGYPRATRRAPARRAR